MTCPNCERLEKLVIELQKRIAQLEARLAVYENAHTPPSQKRFPERKTRDEGNGKPGRPTGFEGSTRPALKPDMVEVVHSSNCTHCGSALGEPASYTSIVVEEIPKPQPVIVTEFKLAQYVCPHCGQEMTATHPDCPSKGVFGYRAMAQAFIKLEALTFQ